MLGTTQRALRRGTGCLVLGCLVLGLAMGCRSQLADTSPSNSAETSRLLSPETSTEPKGDTGTIAPNAVPVHPKAPHIDEEIHCRKRHCYPEAANACFDRCYKYNHPRDPATHERCNESCRRSWSVDSCELACSLDGRAFEPLRVTGQSACEAAFGDCRTSCDSNQPRCELHCIQELHSCETQTMSATDQAQ